MKGTDKQNAVLEPEIASPVPLGSYPPSDVTFLLKDLSSVALELGTAEREKAIQSGVSYSEMLPVEYQPTEQYIGLFRETLQESAAKVALAVAVVSERIVAQRGTEGTVLVSLARAGTPVGVLIRRYIAEAYGAELPHYSVSIIRGKGLDMNAIRYILQQHGTDANLQFVDGWTGKGAITRVLKESCIAFYNRYGVRLSDDLAVLADPGHCSGTFGTREDYLIPSACLNSTVSGLLSRTVQRNDLTGPEDFHGAKFYKEWLEHDYSNVFIDAITPYFASVRETAVAAAGEMGASPPEISWRGMQDIITLQEHFGIDNINLIKPGVGETTRVLLRRVPWKIIVDTKDNPNLRHILLLAEERNVPVEEYPGLAYSCCGIIKPLKGGETE
ncbi:Cysteine protease StiP precursor [compost metagenome]